MEVDSDEYWEEEGNDGETAEPEGDMAVPAAVLSVCAADDVQVAGALLGLLNLHSQGPPHHNVVFCIVHIM